MCVARNDHDVRRRLRIDVAKRDAFRRLRDELRGNLAADDAAEEAVVRHARAPRRDSAARTMPSDAIAAVSKRSVSGASVTGTKPRADQLRALARLEPALGSDRERDRRGDRQRRKRLARPCRAAIAFPRDTQPPRGRAARRDRSPAATRRRTA